MARAKLGENMDWALDGIASQIETITGSQGVCHWENLGSQQNRLRQAIAPETTPSDIVYPHNQAELAGVIACAHRNNWRVLPCGSGSKISWGFPANIQLVVSTERMHQVVQHAVGDLTVTVESGARFADVQNTLATVGQFLALDPTAAATATMGGIVATGDTGSLRQRYGGVRDQLLGLTFVRADGQIAKAGGRVVKNVAGYDLMKLFTGSFGTLGIISQVTFRVYPLPEASQTVVLTGEAGAMAQATNTLRASALTPTAIDLLSVHLVTSLGIGQGWGLIVRFQSLPESVKEQSNRLLAVGQQLGLQGAVYSAGDEAELWQKLREKMAASTVELVITCKIGVLPTAAIATLTELNRVIPGPGMGLIHAGSGLGVLRFDRVDVKTLLQLRSVCEAGGGFLTVLEAPIALKQCMDVWGYGGNAVEIMRRIKQQFDPEGILSPGRFVGGI